MRETRWKVEKRRNVDRPTVDRGRLRLTMERVCFRVGTPPNSLRLGIAALLAGRSRANGAINPNGRYPYFFFAQGISAEGKKTRAGIMGERQTRAAGGGGQPGFEQKGGGGINNKRRRIGKKAAGRKVKRQLKVAMETVGVSKTPVLRNSGSDGVEWAKFGGGGVPREGGERGGSGGSKGESGKKKKSQKRKLRKKKPRHQRDTQPSSTLRR